jgi:hypothetical protein
VCTDVPYTGKGGGEKEREYPVLIKCDRAGSVNETYPQQLLYVMALRVGAVLVIAAGDAVNTDSNPILSINIFICCMFKL